MNSDSKTFPMPETRQNGSSPQKQLSTLDSISGRSQIDVVPKKNSRLYDRNDDIEDYQDTVSQLKWYAVYTKSRFEKKLCYALQNSGFTVYLPMIKEKRIWSDRIKKVTVPLLPSYLFVKLPENSYHLLYCYTGFVRFVSFDGKCSEINEKEIRLLKNIERYGLHVESRKNGYCSGDLVKVVKGPLMGCEGKIDRTKGSRVTFRLDSIHQCVSVELCSDFVERIK
jgi:transcription antitermination factor NusG